jgi:putative hydrolase of the HAD superfamily
MVPGRVVRHLLFDFGGPVLLSPFELRDQGARMLGVDVAAFAGGPFDPGDVRWQARVRGDITEREYWDGEAARFGTDTRGYMRAFYEPSGDHLTRPASVQLVEDALAAGRRVGLLTNDLTAFHGVEWQEPIGVLRRFDPLIDLSQSGHLKPHPAAYETAIVAMGCEPAEIVFVDDHVDNVAGGADAGMVAIWFDVTDPDASLARVRTALALERGHPAGDLAERVDPSSTSDRAQH